ncbi:MAG: signal peptide peptidase SppA [Muribaculaceae bacterium]|nr:signal peptide peptidase SppA [Muribaculaceae bacterium]
MLKKFFLNFLSSFVGAWVALVLFIAVAVFVGIGIVAKLGVSAASKTGSSISSHSVLTLDLSGTIAEIEEATNFDYMTLLQGRMERPQTLNSMVMALREAKVNKSIDGLYIKCNGAVASPATLNALREAVVDFKLSGKPVYAYGDVIGMGDLFVASCADSIFVNPGGEVHVNGINGTVMYMKNLFDKIGVTFQVVKVGTFKSAVEPYILNEMSGPARAQLDTLYGNMWNYIAADLCAKSKGLTRERLDSLVGKEFISYAPVQLAVQNHLVDATAYERIMDDKVAAAIGVKKKKLKYVGVDRMVSQTNWGTAYGSDDQIAVLYATGEIVDGGRGGINFERLVPQIVELADNDDVKAMVLRVNSPGGSAFGSEQIGEALDYFQSKGKILAVSMGDYAASGGYWISCGADRIFADPLTITGSIGIFGLLPNIENLLSKIGVSPQVVGTSPQADFPTLFHNMTPAQRDAMQAYVERGYDKFVGRVAKGRKMSRERVLAIAEGRVWDAQSAKRIGLVDELGSLQQAIEWVADQSDMGKNYDVALYPRLEQTIWNFLPSEGDMFGMKLMQQLAPGDMGVDEMAATAALLNQKPMRASMAPMRVRL